MGGNLSLTDFVRHDIMVDRYVAN